jgi:hypothetical protein
MGAPHHNAPQKSGPRGPGKAPLGLSERLPRLHHDRSGTSGGTQFPLQLFIRSSIHA